MSEPVETAVLSDNVLLLEGITKLLGGGRFHVCPRMSPLEFQKLGDSQGKTPELFIVVIDDTSCAIIGEIKKHFKSAKIVALALRDNHELMCRCIQLGAVAYLVQSISADDLVSSLEVVIANAAVFPLDLLQQLSEVAVTPQRQLQDVHHRADGSPFSGLSSREVSILEGLMLGESNKTIARKLQIAEATVKVHVKAILRKVRVKNRTQAAMWAMQSSPPQLATTSGPESPEELAAALPIRLEAMLSTTPCSPQLANAT